MFVVAVLMLAASILWAIIYVGFTK